MRAADQRVVALVEDGRAYAGLVRALLGHARVERAWNWDELLFRIRHSWASAVVLELFAPLPLAPEYALRHLGDSSHVARLVLLCHLDLRSMDALTRLPPRLPDALLVVGAHDDATIRRRVLSSVGVRDAVTCLRRRLDEVRIAPEISPSLEWCLSRLESEARQRLSVTELALRSGRSRVHLEHLFAHTVHSSPKKLIGLVYAMMAVALLELRPRSRARLAEALLFSSADSLCRSIRRSTGLTLNQIRERGGLVYLVNLLHRTFGVSAVDWPSTLMSEAACRASDDPSPPVTVEPASALGAPLNIR